MEQLHRDAPKVLEEEQELNSPSLALEVEAQVLHHRRRHQGMEQRAWERGHLACLAHKRVVPQQVFVHQAHHLGQEWT